MNVSRHRTRTGAVLEALMHFDKRKEVLKLAVSYKGLVIKFGGDTTELQGALKKVSTESKKTQSDLKEIDKSLKFNPGNTDLLAQKVKTLNKAYDETKQKLDAYKQALSQLEEKKQRGEKLTEEEERQYDSLKRSILQCENQLDSYEKQLEETSKEHEASKTKLYQFGQAIEDNAAKLEKHGQRAEKAGKVVAGTCTGIATAAVAAFTQVEEAENIAVNGAGAIGEAADEIRRSVRDVAATAPGDLESVGQAVGDVNTHFQVTGTRLDQISTAFLQFSKITGGDVSTNIENVAMAMKAFNVPAEDTELVLDHLASTSTATGVSVDTLTSLVNANGSTFREMGLSLQDSVTLLGNFEAAGVPVDSMLAGLKKAAQNCAKEGTNMGDMLTQLTADLQDPAKEAEATQKAFDLFGSKAATSFIDAAKSGRVNLGDLGGSLSDAEGFVSGLCEETMSSSDKMKEAMKGMTLAGADLGAEFTPVIEAAADALKGFTDWVRTLSPEQKQLFAGIVTGGIAFGGLTIGIGKTMQAAASIGGTFKTLAGGMATLKGGTTAATGAMSGLSGGWKALTGLISANPIGLGIAAVSAAVAGLTWFFTQTETGKQMWADFTGWISEKWQGVCDFFSGAGDFFGGIWNDVTSGVEQFKSDVASKWEGFKQDASSTWENIKSTVSEKAQGAADWVKDKWNTLSTATKTYFGGIASTVQKDMATAQQVGSSAGSALQAALSGDWATAKSEAANAFNAIKSNISEKMDAAQSNAVRIADAIGNKLGFPGLGEKVNGVFNSVRDFMKNPIENAWNWIKDIPNKIMNAFGGIKIELPKIKMPHFNVQWNDIGGVVKLPSISVDWCAKGGYFDQASIIGVGEAGGEYVAPERQLWDFIERAVNNAFNGGQPAQQIAVSVEVNATVAGNADAYQTGQQIGLGIASKLKQRGVSVAT